MGRTTGALCAAGLIALIAAASPAGAGAPAGAASKHEGTRGERPAGSTYRPAPVTIVGNPEQPGILFFLPRAEVRFLPVRSDPELAAGPDGRDKRSMEVPR